MKKSCIYAILFTLMALVPAADLAADDTVRIMLSGSHFAPRDAGYKSVYGGGEFLPELSAAVRLKWPFFLCAGYGRLSADGETPALKQSAECSQQFLSLGLGFRGRVARNFSYDIGLGAVDIRYEEEALGLTVSGSALGIRAEAGLSLTITGGFFARASVGYLYAGKDVDGDRVKLGGFRSGIGLGWAF